MRLGAIVIGLGRIGLTSDLSMSADTSVYSHTRAFSQHSSFHLLGGTDVDSDRCQDMTREYGCPTFASLPELLAETEPQVVAIATPTESHSSTLFEVLKRSRPKAILCEKPLSSDIHEAREMVVACQEAGCHLFVNYIRRADISVQEVRRRILAGEIATPLKGVVWYSKGLFHNGSHFFDLMRFWLGELVAFDIVDKGRNWEGDPEPDLSLRFSRGRIQFLAAREEDYSHYTAELVSSSGRLQYDLGGWKVIWQPVLESAENAGYMVLDRVEHEIPNRLARIQWHVADELAKVLSGKMHHCLCTGQEALDALENLTTIKNAL